MKLHVKFDDIRPAGIDQDKVFESLDQLKGWLSDNPNTIVRPIFNPTNTKLKYELSSTPIEAPEEGFKEGEEQVIIDYGYATIEEVSDNTY